MNTWTVTYDALADMLDVRFVSPDVFTRVHYLPDGAGLLLDDGGDVVGVHIEGLAALADIADGLRRWVLVDDR